MPSLYKARVPAGVTVSGLQGHDTSSNPSLGQNSSLSRHEAIHSLLHFTRFPSFLYFCYCYSRRGFSQRDSRQTRWRGELPGQLPTLSDHVDSRGQLSRFPYGMVLKQRQLIEWTGARVTCHCCDGKLRYIMLLATATGLAFERIQRLVSKW